MAIICCWFSRNNSARVSTGSNVARVPSGTVAPVCVDTIGRAPSAIRLKRTESGARTRTAIDRSSRRTSPAGAPSKAPIAASAMLCGVRPTRFDSASLMRMSSSALGSLTPLYRSSTPGMAAIFASRVRA